MKKFILNLVIVLSITFISSGILLIQATINADQPVSTYQSFIIYTLILSGISSILSLIVYSRIQETIEIKLSKNNEKSDKENQIIENNGIRFLHKATKEFCEKGDVSESIEKSFNRLCKVIEAVQGLYFHSIIKDETEYLTPKYTFAYVASQDEDIEIEFGIGFTGLAAKEKQVLIINNLPEDYFEIISGLGKSTPSSLVILPIVKEDKVLGVIELATFYKVEEADKEVLNRIANWFSNLLIQQNVDSLFIAKTHA